MKAKLFRLTKIVSASVCVGLTLQMGLSMTQGIPASEAWRPAGRSWRLENRVDAQNAQVKRWAQQICEQTNDASTRCKLIGALVKSKINYTSSSLMDDGRERLPSVSEIIERGKGNCAHRMILVKSLCVACGLNAEIKSRPNHAWVSVEIGAAQPVRIFENEFDY